MSERENRGKAERHPDRTEASQASAPPGDLLSPHPTSPHELSELRSPGSSLSANREDAISADESINPHSRSWLAKAYASEIPTLRAFGAASATAIAVSSLAALSLGRLNFSPTNNAALSTLIDYASFYGVFVPVMLSTEAGPKDETKSSFAAFKDKFVELVRASAILETVYPCARFFGQLLFQHSGLSPGWAAFAISTSATIFNGALLPIIKYGVGHLYRAAVSRLKED